MVYDPSLQPSAKNLIPPLDDLDSRVLLSESAGKSLEGVNNVLEGLLLLRGDLGDDVCGGVVVLVGPLDLEGVELEVNVEAVDVLGVVRGEAAELVDEGHELDDIILGNGAGLLGGLDRALVLGGANDGRAVGLADDLDGVGGGALGRGQLPVEQASIQRRLTRERLLQADGEFTRGRRSH